jgi:hypothetical protein
VSDRAFVVCAIAPTAASRIEAKATMAKSRRDFLKIARRFNARNKLVAG